MMHRRGESDSAIVAGKPTNKVERSAAEPVEPRAEAKGNARQQSTDRTQSRGTVSQALERIRQVAKLTNGDVPSASAAWRQLPKVGAECPNWARSDLCGGRPVMGGPTAIFDVQSENSSL